MRRVLLALAFLIGVSNGVFAEPLKVGVLIPLSGEMQEFGAKALKGVELAQAELPGVNFTVEDVGTGASTAVATAVSKLLNQDRVSVIIGQFFLDQTMVAAPLTERAGVPLFSQTLCSPNLSRFKQVACGYPSSKEQLAVLGRLLTKLSTKRIYFVAENGSYGEDTLREARLAISGSEVVSLGEDRVNAGERDFRTLILRLLSKKPDTVFAVTADPGQSFVFFQQLKQLGFKGNRIGYLDIDPKYIQEFGQSIEGIYLPGFISPNYSPDFVVKFHSRYQLNPDMYSALAYDLTRTVVLGALKDSPDPLYQRVLAYALTNPAVVGYKFRTDGSVSVPVSVLKIENGNFVEATENE